MGATIGEVSAQCIDIYLGPMSITSELGPLAMPELISLHEVKTNWFEILKVSSKMMVELREKRRNILEDRTSGSRAI